MQTPPSETGQLVWQPASTALLEEALPELEEPEVVPELVMEPELLLVEALVVLCELVALLPLTVELLVTPLELSQQLVALLEPDLELELAVELVAVEEPPSELLVLDEQQANASRVTVAIDTDFMVAS